MRAGRTRLVLGFSIALVVGIAAFALLQPGDDATTVGPSAVAEAADRTAKVDGMRYSLTGETDVPQVGKVTFKGEGVSDLRGERGTGHVDMSQMADRIGGSGPEADPENWQMDMVFDRRYFYMRFPLIESELDGKEWMKFDVLEVSEAMGIDPALVRAEQQQGSDPSSTLRYLRAVSDEVERVGTEKIGGVESTHYRATVELRKYPDLVPADEREQARKSVARLIELSGGDDEMEMEIWVGDDKLIRRMKYEQTLKVPGAPEPVSSSYTTDFFAFGARVNVEPPPASDVKDVTDEVSRQLAAQR